MTPCAHLSNYWGKSQKTEDGKATWHLLVCHCLDVAIVTRIRWQRDTALLRRFCTLLKCDELRAEAWLLFFIALHDLGKFDARFQAKAPDAAAELGLEDANISQDKVARYHHGKYTWYWLRAEEFEKDDNWRIWSQAVAGHNGEIPPATSTPDHLTPKGMAEEAHKRDRSARRAFVDLCASLFLAPAGLTLDSSPPMPVAADDPDDESPTLVFMQFLAGFCSVCDWIGSAEQDAAGRDAFTYIPQWPGDMSVVDYLALRQPIAERLVSLAGVYRPALCEGGMAALFEYPPRQVQTLVDQIPLAPGLTLIEAATGSGKTEAALAYASRLLAAGTADSIVFALPTQATANAMLQRLHFVADKLFPGEDATNLVLAHGKARFSKTFVDLKKTAARRMVQSRDEQEASVACALWLAQSRKRVFLGQIGVCTIDQALLSVLPLRHKFVRGFGLGRSVLIIDEVHAYDAYMYGLIEELLRSQRFMGGSAVLLSATLPHNQRQSLVDARTGAPRNRHHISLNRMPSYPLITHIFDRNNFELIDLPPDMQKQVDDGSRKQVTLTIREVENMRPENCLLQQIIGAVERGALVGVLCNLVQDAQTIAQKLRQMTELPVDLFHSRFRFKGRQRKEGDILDLYGKGKKRAKGRILVGTLLEQSLDLDFDWMISQLCPIDSLFQRLGRLHRHERERPIGFGAPRVTVLLPRHVDGDAPDYVLHQLIYGLPDAPNTVLWRTEQLLRKNAVLDFPFCYRRMIEQVYDAERWEDEPSQIDDAGYLLHVLNNSRKRTAQQRSALTNDFPDSEAFGTALTRDGEMNLNVVPVILRAGQRYLLDEKNDKP